MEVGSYVLSNKGHDKQRLYVVVKIEGEFAYLVDGKYRLLECPKKKRLKHLTDLHDKNLEIKAKLKEKKLYDFEIKTILKNFDSKLHKN